MTSRARTWSRWGRAPASAHAGCAPEAGVATASTSSHRQLQHLRRIDDDTGIAVPVVHGADLAALRRRQLRRGVQLVPAVRGRHRRRRGRDRAGAAPGRPLRVLDHPPDALDDPGRPGPRGLRGVPVLLGPHADSSRSRTRPGTWRTSSTTAPWATGRPAGPARLPPHRPPRAERPRGTTGSGVAGRPPAVGSLPGPRCSARTGSRARLDEVPGQPIRVDLLAALVGDALSAVALGTPTHQQEHSAEQAQDAADESDDRDHGQQVEQADLGLDVLDRVLDGVVGPDDLDVERGVPSSRNRCWSWLWIGSRPSWARR